MVERVTVPDMMNAREARAQAQRMLLERHPGASVVCLCMNIAGPVKRTEKIERAFAWGASAVRAVLEPYETLFDAEIHEKTGPEAMFCLHGDAQEIKRRLCFLEDGCALGRLLDIDVIASDGRKPERKSVFHRANACSAKTMRLSAQEAARTVPTSFLPAQAKSSTRILKKLLSGAQRKTHNARCSARLP